ncbi:MAG: hypothetical protein JW801_16990 [Bacteroidales bacterium]|nr:hypothetical protein [Bacteroidales bacterium]
MPESEKYFEVPTIKIKLIVVYFGPLPILARYFIYSCKYNPDFTFVIFTDQPAPDSLPPNVKVIPYSKPKFEELVKIKTGLHIRLLNPYKICDFKPTFGHLFEDFLTDADFWGYCDLDMIFGTIADFITPECLENYDVISSRKNSLAGNFTLFRNTGDINKLYQKALCWKLILSNTFYHHSFPERFKFSPIRKVRGIQKPVRLLVRWCITLFKKQDLNTLIKRNPKIKTAFINSLLSDEILKNQQIVCWEIRWKEGKMLDYTTNREIMYFHFYRLKNDPAYQIPTIKASMSPQLIIISPSSVCIK